MSFVRPEIARFFASHKPLVWVSTGVGLGLLLVWRGLATYAAGPIVLGLSILSLSAMLYVAWHQRSRFARKVSAPGVVRITEARIDYFGPEIGGFIDLDAINEVALRIAEDGTAHWCFEYQGDAPLEIPLAALGAEDIPDLLSALPGVNLAEARAALDAGTPTRLRIWRLPET